MKLISERERILRPVAGGLTKRIGGEGKGWGVGDGTQSSLYVDHLVVFDDRLGVTLNGVGDGDRKPSWIRKRFEDFIQNVLLHYGIIQLSVPFTV